MAKKETLFFLAPTGTSNKLELGTLDSGPTIHLNTKTNEIEVVFTANGPKNPPQGDPPAPSFKKVKITSRIKKDSEVDPVKEAKFTLGSPSLTYTFRTVAGGKAIGEYVLKFNLNEAITILP